MKKLLLLLAFAGLLLNGCSETDVDKTPTFAFGKNVDLTPEINPKGESLTFDFVSQFDWQTTVSEDWISVEPESGTAQDKSITVTFQPNKTGEARTGTITITLSNEESFYISVSQESEDVVFVDADKPYQIGYEGGEITIAISTNAEYIVDIPEEAKEWLTLADTRTLRDEILTFTATKNEGKDVRSAVVKLLGMNSEPLQTFTIEQQCVDIFESKTEAEYTVSSDGGVVEIEVATNIEYTVEIPEEAQAWLRLSDTRAYREEKLSFVVLENEEYSPRSAVVRLWDAKGLPLNKFIIAQSAKTGNPNQIIYSSAGGVVAPTTAVGFGASIISNVYEKGVGIITFTGDINAIPDNAFKNCKMLTGITLPETVVTIGANAFYGCEALPIFTIPDSVTSIGYSAFSGCTGELIVNSKIIETYYSYDNCPSESGWLYNSKFTKLTIGDNITKIGKYAFGGCTSLVSVTIPDSVTSIGSYAFYNCTSLTRVDITDLSAWCKISFSNGSANPLYYTKKLHLNGSELTDITIPSDITEIKAYAFYNYTSLTSITIPDSVTAIGDYAFLGCSSLTSVTIPDNVTSIGSWAFEGCTSLTTITIPNSVTSIGSWAFEGCTSLTTITIPNSVTSIGYSAFSGCTGELIVNSKIIETYYSYDNCPSESGWLYNSKFTKLTIGDNITKIGKYAFGGCTSLASVTIPDSVTTIGDSAFEDCTSLTSVTIPDSVTKIGGRAFGGCSSLKTFYGKFASEDNRCLIVGGVLNSFAIGCGATEYTIPDSVTSIGDVAFGECTSLTSITIPDSVTAIGDYAFLGCSSLTSVTIPDNVTSIGAAAFYCCRSLKRVTIGNSVTSIGYDAFRECTSLTSVTIGNGVTSIGNSAFYGCTSLKSVTIGDSVTSIGGKAFRGCTSLTSVTIPDSVTSIGYEAFRDCSSLTSITIPDSVTSIGYKAFSYCTLKSVTIGNSVTSIGEEAFYVCASLTSVYCKPTTPPTGGYDMFYNNAYGRKIYVPRNSVGAYKEASGWSKYASSIVGYDF